MARTGHSARQPPRIYPAPPYFECLLFLVVFIVCALAGLLSPMACPVLFIPASDYLLFLVAQHPNCHCPLIYAPLPFYSLPPARAAQLSIQTAACLNPTTPTRLYMRPLPLCAPRSPYPSSSHTFHPAHYPTLYCQQADAWCPPFSLNAGRPPSAPACPLRSSATRDADLSMLVSDPY